MKFILEALELLGLIRVVRLSLVKFELGLVGVNVDHIMYKINLNRIPFFSLRSFEIRSLDGVCAVYIFI